MCDTEFRIRCIDGDGLSAFTLYTSYAQYCNEMDTAICHLTKLAKITEYSWMTIWISFDRFY